MDSWDFIEQFQFFTGSRPYPWQQRLYHQLVAGQVPRQVAIPTGLGKTSVMLVWLLALAAQAKEKRMVLPRRLMYVVNRRTVVDQATLFAEQLRTKLQLEHPVACVVRQQLQKLASVHGVPLAISTLRGQFADNGEWKEDPTRPAIIVGTVDMTGSKLLFSGYGDSFKRRPIHAGLLGQDTLVVHDEAHLEPAFEALLQQIVELQKNRVDWQKPFRVMALSASLRESCGEVFTLDTEDLDHPEVSRRLNARKTCFLHEVPKAEVAEKVAELAAKFEGQPVRVLIFVRSPVMAQEEVTAYLREATGNHLAGRLVLLTGTMRGAERDALLVENKTFRAFVENHRPAETHYLIATSAGEVGVDLDADHLVSELAPLDSLLQRLGRVNRRGGEGREAEVHVVVPGELGDRDPLGPCLRATREILKRWTSANASCDLSPQSLSRFFEELSEEERKAAFSPVPRMVTLTDIHMDCLAATSVKELPAGSPHVPHLLHGEEAAEPELYVLWRQELSLFSDLPPEKRNEGLREWLSLCPPMQRELVRLSVSFFSKFCAALAKKGEAVGQSVTVVLGPRNLWVTSLGELARWPQEELAFTTVVLDPLVGGLDADTGAADPKASGPVVDVAEQVAGGAKIRQRLVLVEDGDGRQQFFDLHGQDMDTPEGWEMVGSVPLEEDEEGNVKRSLCLWLPLPEVTREEAERAGGELALGEHIQHVVAWVHAIADRLDLPEAVRCALEKAAQWHDRGKENPLWQYFAYAEGRKEALAKSRRYRDPRVLSGFRHELASWRAMSLEQEFAPVDSLAKHLVAAHHGWARPLFPSSCWDGQTPPERQEEALVAMANDFAQLQHQLGWWTLAWLEAVFRAADALASRHQAPPLGAQNDGVTL
ncbi:MAG: type I-U CRISPR-associated helicase/endonuclease Cas3 [Thermoanaerobaculum sp.]